MSEVRLVVAILVPAIFTLILKDFFDLFMTNRYEGKVKQYTIWMLYFLLDTAISMNFKFVGVISMLYSFIILIIFCAVLYREDIKYITLTVLFIICIGAASELIVALGIRAFLNSSQLQQFSLFGSTCSKLIILIIVRIVKLFRVSGIKRLDYMNWLANVSMTAGSLYIVYNLYLLSLNETKLLGSTMSSIIILLLNVICFKMFDKIAADAEIKRKNDIYKQSIDIYKREMEEREEHNEKLRRFRHDIKNHLIAIEKLALSKEYVRLRDYIHQLTDEKGVLQVTTISGNALIDGLLADKFDVARKYEIAVEYHIEIPTKLPFDCFMLTVLPVISTVVVYNIFLITSRIDRLELIAFSTVSSTLILALNLLVYDIYIKLLEQTEIRRENAIYEKQISLFQEQIYVKETAMLNDKMVRDKFYHQLSFIKELVYQRELSQLNEFIDGIMQNKKIEKDGPANSGNVLLDYIVNNKCEIAVKQGIECTVKIEVPYKFPFSDGDIFIILGNALDNAIEGALKCVSRRYIHIKIIYRKENLFIKISNSFDGKVKKDRHGHLISMKSDLTRYGLGLALIEKSVNKYNGLLNFDIDEENFTLTVLLYS